MSEASGVLGRGGENCAVSEIRFKRSFLVKCLVEGAACPSNLTFDDMEFLTMAKRILPPEVDAKRLLYTWWGVRVGAVVSGHE